MPTRRSLGKCDVVRIMWSRSNGKTNQLYTSHDTIVPFISQYCSRDPVLSIVRVVLTSLFCYSYKYILFMIDKRRIRNVI